MPPCGAGWSTIVTGSIDRVVAAPPNGTICELIYLQLQRIYEDQDHAPHEDEFVRLSNILLPGTKTYGVYVLAIHHALANLDYATALRAGQAMLQHETWLHAIAAGQNSPQAASLN